MSFKRIGILSIGEMGYHWARVLRTHGVEVLTCAGDRSTATRSRADSAGVKLVPSLEKLVSLVDIIVSIVVPFAAKQVAERVAQALLNNRQTGLLYMDANAISPMTAEEVNRILTQAHANYVDGCILGGAANLDKSTVVYVSGPQASSLNPLNELGLSIKILGPGVTQASAFKVIHAGLTKGLAGLLTELLVGAEKFGLLKEALADYDRAFPGLLQKVGHSIASLPLHAARRSEEMAELRETFLHYGLDPIVVPSVEKILRAISDLKSDKASLTNTRGETLANTIKLFSERGLLRESSSTKLPSQGKAFQEEKQRE